MKILGIIGIILLCILAVPVFLLLSVLLICCFKTRIRLKLTPEQREVWVSHLFFKKQVYPLPPKKEKPPRKKKAPEEKKPPKEKDRKEENGLSEKLKSLTISDYTDFIRAFKDGFIRRIKFEKLHLEVKVGTPSADLTAQRYGQLSAAVFPLLGKLDAAGKIKDGKVSIKPDFLCEETSVWADVDVSLRIIHVFTWATGVVFKIITK